ncbi:MULTISPECIES: HpcH/HpaI aldolase/citrate lyase family protein [unclassified Neorhizobium]|uniref:HpcH/HpaI aldolase family protein n=1 Tax=unclassified Neorhizobium TaxID=2629175 RepID=UPI001FF20C64|nr:MULTISPECIES: aldolase/citrate lyase family protein [unclassified Neorhizobium]MCJ9669465.1 aldolase/citrate lyase family protein [Neorhizobium sp. SHOUNA12B]MCJ9745510.1 aldolase/citrate lyase family protein [Neorhizobium sp. SHOUNA12A]
MTRPRHSYRQFASRLRGKEPLTGTFIKTPTGHATEILGLLGFDFVVFDMEHAGIGVGALDQMLVSARAAEVASIVRIAEASSSKILTALDLGANGILVPHIRTAEEASRIVAACRYTGGVRGFANTTRAGDYGLVGYEAHMSQQDNEVVCLAMIEDLEAIGVIDDIVSVHGLDGIFIGRGDLTAALGGKAIDDPTTTDVVITIAHAAKRRGMPVITICLDGADAGSMTDLGVTAVMISSDQGFLIKGARAALDSLDAFMKG